MCFVLSSKRTDLEALVCCAAAAKTCQPVGFTSQVTFLLPHHSVLLCTAATRHHAYLLGWPTLQKVARTLEELGSNLGSWGDLPESLALQLLD